MDLFNTKKIEKLEKENKEIKKLLVDLNKQLIKIEEDSVDWDEYKKWKEMKDSLPKISEMFKIEDLKNELHKLKTVDRPNVINQIAEARDKGDLSENAEYDAAKEAQGLLEARIAKLEADLSNSRIIDESKLDNSKVSLLSNVTIKNLVNNSEMCYTIVSESEADLSQKKISASSPIGKGLIGKEVGEIAEIEVPNGIIKFEILKITL